MNAALIVGAVALVAIIAAFLKGRGDGARIERARQAEAERATLALADSVDAEVDALPAIKVRQELKQWSRD
jgi:hypothetical protein